MTTLENQQAHQEALEIIRNLRTELQTALAAKEQAERTVSGLNADLRAQVEYTDSLRKHVEQAERERDEARKALACESVLVAPLRIEYPVIEFIKISSPDENGLVKMMGRWAEDGSPYFLYVPHQLAEPFMALQRLATAAAAARKEAPRAPLTTQYRRYASIYRPSTEFIRLSRPPCALWSSTPRLQSRTLSSTA